MNAFGITTATRKNSTAMALDALAALPPDALRDVILVAIDRCDPEWLVALEHTIGRAAHEKARPIQTPDPITRCVVS